MSWLLGSHAEPLAAVRTHRALLFRDVLKRLHQLVDTAAPGTGLVLHTVHSITEVTGTLAPARRVGEHLQPIFIRKDPETGRIWVFDPAYESVLVGWKAFVRGTERRRISYCAVHTINPDGHAGNRPLSTDLAATRRPDPPYR